MRFMFVYILYVISAIFCPAQAAESTEPRITLAAPEVKFWLNASVPVSRPTATRAVKWHFHAFMPNLVQPGGRAPWFYTGPSWQVNDQFNLELVGGFGTGIGDDASGVAPVAGLWLTWTPPQGWFFWSALEWWGLPHSDTLFAMGMLTKQVKQSPVSLGIEARATWTPSVPDSAYGYAGLNIGLRLNQQFSVRVALLAQGGPNSEPWGVGPNIFLFFNPQP
jgi:hypothetical protein